MKSQNKSRKNKVFSSSISVGILVCMVLLFQFTAASAQVLVADAGIDQSVCQYDTAIIGGNPAATGGQAPYTYSWLPTNSLNSSNIENPKAFPTAPAVYTLTVTDSLGNTSQDFVTISHLPLPTVNAGLDQTIIGGTNTSLVATGAVNYFWSPTISLENQNTATPTAEPGSTTTYCVAGVDENGCANFDCMILVVNPSDTLIIYNAFSPNGDGINDVLFIGNLAAFPDNNLQVFNRNGKLVFQESQYKNDWDGKIEGTELPAATYYIIIDLGPENRRENGAVTIIR